MAQWAQDGIAKYDKMRAEYEAAHPTKDEQIRKQQRKIDDQERELNRLRKQVRGHEAAERHRKKRKTDAENQRQRRRLHSQHPAVSMFTPESTTKRIKARTSRTSSRASPLACIGDINSTTIV